MGRVGDVFSGNPDAVIRTAGANPLVLEVRLPTARRISRVRLGLGNVDCAIRPVATTADGASHESSARYEGAGREPRVDLEIPGRPEPVGAIRIELTKLYDGEVTHVHLRDVIFR